MKHIVKIKSTDLITHDVLKIITDKPPHYNFTPGQATEVSINKPEWKEKKNPFTFTCLPEDDFLEFNIKTYPEHKGATNELLKLRKEDELILHDVFGAISYMGEGVFIAGGAGITPFISIFRYLKSKNVIGENKLIFANKTKKDIILEQEFKDLLGRNFINILSDEKADGYAYGQITENFLKANMDVSVKNVYVCGPPPMMEAIQKQLLKLEISESFIITEEI
jgi:predicted ferric reductase